MCRPQRSEGDPKEPVGATQNANRNPTHTELKRSALCVYKEEIRSAELKSNERRIKSYPDQALSGGKPRGGGGSRPAQRAGTSVLTVRRGSYPQKL